MTSNHLPNLDELLLRTVLALPNASKIGFADKIRSSIDTSPSFKEQFRVPPPTSAKYCKHFLVVSVLPAPLSPAINMAWLDRVRTKPR